MSKLAPYISVVVSGRNDNYGEDFTLRIQNQITWLGMLAEKYELPIEYVLVNYNPIENKASLRETLKWPTNNHFSVLQVTVPSELHETFIDSQVRKTLPLFEFIAKNAGIKRCTAPFILTTNADILFHPKLIEKLAKRTLDKDTLYRTDRIDHHYKSRFEDSLNSYLCEMDKSVFKYFLKGGTYEFSSFRPRLKTLQTWHKWITLPLKRLLKSSADIASITGLRINLISPETLEHCNASGDFLLAHRDQYHSLRGFPEDTYISTHTDSIMVYKFIHGGLKVHEFSEPVYHADHERRFKFDTPLGDPDMAKMYRRLQLEIETMARNKKPTLFNDENWGMNGHELQIDNW
ncbi:MAG: hypothetical protein ACI9FU_002400 [Granulosicoccus sp.]|jgi:hypothetical protein